MAFPPYFTVLTAPVSGNWWGQCWTGTRFAIGEEVNENLLTLDPPPAAITDVKDKGFYSFWALAGDGDAMVGVGPQDQARYTTDGGVSWANGSLPSPTARNWWGIATNGAGTWVAVTDDGTNRGAASTNNGATWAARALSNTVAWSAICWNGTYFFAVGVNGSNQGVWSRSTNGTSWSAPSVMDSSFMGCNGIAANAAGDLVAIGYDNTSFGFAFAHSNDDGATWTTGDAGLSSVTSAECVVCTDDGWIAMGGSQYAAYSADGVTWGEVALPGSSYFLGGAGGGPYAVFGSYATDEVYVYGTAVPPALLDDAFFHFSY